MSKRVVHWRPSAEVNRTACGKRVYFGAIHMTPKGHVNYSWSSLSFVARRPAGACTECYRQSRLTSDQRERERQEKSATLKARFVGKATRKAWIEAWGKLGRFLAIEMTRPDALVCLDYIEEGSMDRDRAVLMSPILSRCILLAFLAHRAANPKSRGERIWVYRAYENYKRSPLGVRVTVRGRSNVHCRFCDLMLDVNVPTGHSSEQYGPSYRYKHHLIPCALKYLAGDMAPKINPENLSDVSQ